MLSARWFLSLTLTLLGVALLLGCGGPAATEKPAAKKDQPAAADRGAKQPAAGAAENEVPEGLKELGAEDRAAAEKQGICPVSKELLGSMGKPPKVDAGGRTVFICCEGCRDKLLKDPEKYLANLK